jgi:hypothetical protein
MMQNLTLSLLEELPDGLLVAMVEELVLHKHMIPADCQA